MKVKKKRGVEPVSSVWSGFGFRGEVWKLWFDEGAVLDRVSEYVVGR